MKPPFSLLTLLVFLALQVSAQPNTKTINWMNFEDLDKALHEAPGKVVIYFYADWCVYCKKMEQNAFKDKEIINILNKEFYSVKMNVESSDTIVFDRQKFVNEQALTKRNGIHQLAALLTGYTNAHPPLPAILVLDKNFIIRKKSREYLTGAQLKKLLNI